ncbi:MAG: T9SS type A sorting domain-containing protein [Bacteroidetes bacterium]|nr:T9SS type A sorting domain-containing protein [Bacteroidota bacterium]
MNFNRYCIIISALLVFSCIAAAQDHTAWTSKASLYEVNVRQYTKAGTFNAFGTHLDRLRDLGVSIIWFMPIHPIGSKNRLGSLGSYYAVKDYYGVNPEFGSAADFRTLVDSIHAKGMHVMIDWVANHTSWDNVLTVSHPSWYVKGNGGVFTAPPGTNWSDVIQLDYTNDSLRTYMIDAMKYWVTEMKVDGFRYDAASFVPISFWSQTATALKQLRSDIFLLAEDQETQYSGAGFHMTFGWNFYGFGGGILPKLTSGASNANDLAAYTANEYLYYPGNVYRLYFTSNHDENSWYGTDTELFGAAADAFIALSATLRGMPLIYGGQEVGLNRRLKFFDKDEIPWPVHPRTARIHSLLQLKKRNSALWNGSKGAEPARITTTSDLNVYAFLRQKGNDKVLSVYNLSGTAKEFALSGSTYSGTFKDIFTDSTLQLTPNYQMTLPAWGYMVAEGVAASSAVKKDQRIPSSFEVEQNYPNPFNPSTTISYSIPVNGFTTLTVYDLIGQEVAHVVSEFQEAGKYTSRFDATDISSGVYFYQVRSGSFSAMKKMILLK